MMSAVGRVMTFLPFLDECLLYWSSAPKADRPQAAGLAVRTMASLASAERQRKVDNRYLRKCFVQSSLESGRSEFGQIRDFTDDQVPDGNGATGWKPVSARNICN